MKNFSIAILACSFLLIPNVQAQTIAHVDYEKVMLEMVEYKQATKQLRNYSKSIQNTFEKKQEEFKEYQSQIENKIEQGLLNQSEILREQTKIRQRYNDLEQELLLAEVDLKTKEQALVATVHNKLNDAIKLLARENGYAYIVDKNHFLYVDGGIDVTNDLALTVGIVGFR
ncbi:OmpH family outer membrane protein [Alteromonas oceanisediminis]|uniref:OmpH family outer membrane protein n=1 Tax=Alteromonas oceanisediminis TaxID=2836180 RepID=UPI001BD99E0D|nr:OmpH family outer membrane protein [Alteromonas oceanisediminis]MBT0587807.1 OmpH family outer membrane protein [Alteromonas oceanisediminis]